MWKHLFVFFAALMVVFGAQAGDLTPAQKVTLKAAILAEAPLAQAVADRTDSVIADYCNAAVVPAQKAWKVSYSATDLFSATDLNVYIARSVAERQAYDLLITIGTINPTSTSIRSGVMNIFSGAAAPVVAQRSAILTDMTRPATWCEVKLGGTAATSDTVTALRLNWSGTLQTNDISNLLN